MHGIISSIWLSAHVQWWLSIHRSSVTNEKHASQFHSTVSMWLATAATSPSYYVIVQNAYSSVDHSTDWLTPAAGLVRSRVHKYETILWSSVDLLPLTVTSGAGSTTVCLPPAFATGAWSSSDNNSNDNNITSTLEPHYNAVFQRHCPTHAITTSAIY